MEELDSACPRCKGDPDYMTRVQAEARRVRVRRWCATGAKLIAGIVLIVVLVPVTVRLTRQHLLSRPRPPQQGPSADSAAATTPPTAARATNPAPSTPGSQSEFSDPTGEWAISPLTDADVQRYAPWVESYLSENGYRVHELTLRNLNMLRHTSQGTGSEEGQFLWSAVLSIEGPGVVVVADGNGVVTWGGTDREVVIVSVRGR